MSQFRARAPESSESSAGQEPASAPAILIVDDEPAVRRFVADALLRRGYEVFAAVGGREALRAIYDGSIEPDLVLAGVDLPAMHGLELAARLAVDRPGIRIVLMTGRPESAELARDHPDLVAGVLLKPFSVDVLLATVDDALDAAHGEA